MAGVPAPELTIDLPQPLFDLTRSCETECVVACCGTDAFVLSSASIASWLEAHGVGPAWLALDQLADLIRQVEGHSGSVVSGGDDFNRIWATAAEATSYLRLWWLVTFTAVETVTGRSLVLDPAWRTATVLALADGIYVERGWERLPVLADALEDAGCTQPDILGHLRGPGPHARGCWVVDLLLGKG